MSSVSFNNQKSPFFRTLKAKVDNYFSENEIHPSGTKKLFFKGIIILLSAAIIYTILVFFTPGIFLSIILCVLFGINLGAIGFNIMHEGSHKSFSKNKWINKASAYSLNVLGGESNFWKIKHNVNHHTYTNIHGLDSDIELEPFMRLHGEQKRYWFHKFQHIYWVLLYGISYFAWVFYQDFEKYFTRKIAIDTKLTKITVKEHVIFWSTKIFYTIIYLVLPIMMVGLLKAIIGFTIVAFVTGLFISVVFQLAHVVEDTQFPLPSEEKNKIETEWAVHQVLTTANFATKNKFLSWLLGGLNFQVEHHLFPKVSHIHYPKINQIVKETCEQFNINYIEYPTFSRAFLSHMLHIKRMGRE